MIDNVKIQGYHFFKTKMITKGLSGDKKYYLETEDGKHFLARISDSSEYERKKTAYKRLQKASKVGISMPTPVAFDYCDDQNKIYTLLTWVEGLDAEKVLAMLPQKQQYRMGIEAGKTLRTLHDNSLVEDCGDWQSRYFSVMESRLEAYRTEGTPFEGSSQMLAYLEANKHLLSQRPQTIHHGDFHLGNILIGRDGQLSVIDWDSSDFDNIGDPWYEFNRINIEHTAFASGQIDGYFNHKIPDTFWQLLAFYLSGSAITSIVWAKKCAPECLNEIMKRNIDIVHWYDGMQNLIPSWYKPMERREK